MATVLHDGENLARNVIVVLTSGLLLELQMSDYSEARAKLVCTSRESLSRKCVTSYCVRIVNQECENT